MLIYTVFLVKYAYKPSYIEIISDDFCKILRNLAESVQLIAELFSVLSYGRVKGTFGAFELGFIYLREIFECFVDDDEGDHQFYVLSLIFWPAKSGLDYLPG